MLQVDHIYEFLYNNLFKDFEFWNLFNGVVQINPVKQTAVSVFTRRHNTDKKIFFYDQEPLVSSLSDPYIDMFNSDLTTNILATSEYSSTVDSYAVDNNFKKLYYFFHGFAAVDWYRGHYALNYNKPIVKQYNYDFISFNRIINNDRSYRIYFVSQLKAQGLLSHGQVSFNVTDNLFDDWQDRFSGLLYQFQRQTHIACHFSEALNESHQCLQISQ